MFTLERAASDRAVRWPTLVGLILVPLVVASGFLWATWNSQTRLGRVQAAVVNLDQAVTINHQIVPLGRQLAGGLVTGAADQNFSWVLSDAADASAGLASGRYAAVVTIPKTFSADATSYSHQDATGVKPATLDVQTSQVAGIADPVVGQEIAAVATRTLSSQLTERYLQNVYLGFNTLSKQFASVADAAGQLSTGTIQVAKGITGASQGTAALSGGLGKLDTGAASLSTGTGQLSNGVGSLSTGLQKLAGGTARLPAQTRQLADGTAKTASGASQLAGGLRKFDRSLPAFTAGTKKNAAGTKKFAAGAASYRDGVRTYADGAQKYVAGLQAYDKAITGLGRSTPAELAKIVSCPAQIPQTACQVFYAGLQAGVQVGTGAATKGLADQGRQPGLLSGAKALAGGAHSLSGGADQLASGAAKISGGAGNLNSGAKSIAAGVDKLSSGAGQLSGGLQKLSSGTDQLANGTKALSRGIAGASSGATTLATGADELSAGAARLADGAHRSSGGAAKLSTGMAKLSTGGVKLAGGAKKLADGLKKGKGQIPTYDKTAREKLSSVVTTPVSTRQPTSAFADVATTTFLAVIALWIGALTTYLVLRAVSSRVLSSRKSSGRLVWEALLPGVLAALVQAGALTLVLHALLDLSARHTGELLGLAALTGLAFVAVNHALVAWFGGVGRFVSVVMVVLAAAGALTSAVPALFDAVEPFLPLTPALTGLRAVITGGPGTSGAVGLLLAWLVVGVAAGVLAVARRRVVSPLAVPAFA